jgi:hypothetical protein
LRLSLEATAFFDLGIFLSFLILAAMVVALVDQVSG